jgi:hypothetical protein
MHFKAEQIMSSTKNFTFRNLCTTVSGNFNTLFLKALFMFFIPHLSGLSDSPVAKLIMLLEAKGKKSFSISFGINRTGKCLD